jgi:protein-S-isoprenylcysteine O-methyltransferase Ste14
MIDLFILAAYGSLLLELLLVPVPSVASAVQLARQSRAGGDGGIRRRLREVFHFFPVVLNIAVFLLPFTQALKALLDGQSTTLTGSIASWGVLLVLSGRFLTVASALALRSQAMPRLTQGELHAPLHERGVFRFSRNPGLVGMYLFAAGLLTLKPSLWFALGLAHYVWHMHRKVTIEEGHLEQRLGREYAIYAGRTRRYV